MEARPSTSTSTQSNISAETTVQDIVPSSSSTAAEDKAARRRAADAELRERETAARRQRRQADPEQRAREAAGRRQRRAADPSSRERHAAATRQRRAADPGVREREAAASKGRRLEAAAAAAEPVAPEGAGAEAVGQRQRDFGGADARFKRQFLDRSFGHSCDVCDRLWFDNNLTTVGNMRNAAHRTNALRVLLSAFVVDAANKPDNTGDNVSDGVNDNDGFSGFVVNGGGDNGTGNNDGNNGGGCLDGIPAAVK